MSILQCPLDRKKVDRLFHWVILIGLAILMIALAVYSYAGYFSRYLADDYCFSSQIKNEGIFNGLADFYGNISNRFGAFLFIALTEFFGTGAIQLLPGVMIVMLFFSLFLIFRGVLHQIKLTDSILIALLMSALAVFLVLYQAPNLYQTLYWRSGMASYFAPLPFFFTSVGILIQAISESHSRRTGWIWIILVFLMTFFSGGMSETFAAFQLTFWLLCLAAILSWRKQSIFNFLLFLDLAALAGSLLAMMTMLLAPGNQLRLDAFHQAGSLITVLQFSFRYAWDFIFETFHGLPIPTLFTIIISALLGYHLSHGKDDLFRNKKMPISLVAIPLAAFFLVAAVCAPTVYGMLAYPELRALFIARIVLTLSFALWGGILGILSHRLMDRIINVCFASILVLGILWFYPVRGIIQIGQQIPLWQSRAASWDARQAEIQKDKTQGIQVVAVNALDSIAGVAELSSDPQNWVNQCAAKYYGLQSIRAVEKIP